MEDIRKIETKKMVKQIRKERDNPFSTFLVIELRDRFENRSAEEKHLNFDQWLNIYMLRDEKEEKEKEKNDKRRKEKKYKAFLKEINVTKNKEKYKGIEIPDFVKRMRTKELLSLRFSYDIDFDDIFVYAELANRPHIPNKKEGKKLRREAAKRKK